MNRAPPDAKAVARRAIALRHLAGFALSTPPRDMVEALKPGWTPAELQEFRAEARASRDERVRELGRWLSCLTLRERKIFRSDPETLDERDHINASWRTEGVHVLAWALRAESRLLPFDRQASLKKYRHFASGDLAAFVRKAKLRPRKELEAARDLAEFWHWRSRTRQLLERGDAYQPDEQDLELGIRGYDDIVRYSVAAARKRGGLRARQVKDGDFKARGKAYRDLTDGEWSEVTSITSERHLALNWLCGYAPRNSWEQTPTDT
jgi:hypothetical protein